VIHCGDFCGECTNILRQADAFHRIEPQRTKFCELRSVESKSLKMKYVPRGAMNLLLISGLQVRVLPGSPLNFLHLWYLSHFR
jgi:hypothetical protein